MALNFHRVRALVEAELHAMRREPIAVASLAMVCVMAGASGPASRALADTYGRKDEDDSEVTSAYPCEPGVMPSVAVEGEAPAWLAWPDPFVPIAEADLLMTVHRPVASPQVLEITRLAPRAPSATVQDCLSARIDDERDRRLLALGVTESPDSVVEVRSAPPTPAQTPPEQPLSAGLAVISGIGATLGAVFADLGPRARASGWLESLVSLPGDRADIIGAWTSIGLLAATVATALILVGDRVAVAVTGMPTGMMPLPLIPPLVFVLVAVAVRSWLDAADLRAAAVHLVPVMLMMLLLAGVAQLVEARLPGAGAAVPLGGLFLVVAGKLHGALLASVTAVGAGLLLLRDAVHQLETTVVRAGPMSGTASRRAAGDYRPEAALLVLLAIAGMAAWAPPEMVMRDPAMKSMLSMLLYLAVPAWVIAWPLRLDRRELLSLRAPPLRAWPLAVPLVLGTLSAGGLLWRVGAWLFPDEQLINALGEAIGEMDSGFGLVALSVVPGLCEELMFRGAILGLLRKRMPAWAAILLQAAAFSLLHGLAVRLPHTFGLGVLFGILTVVSGSVLPGMVAHAAHNLISVLLPADALLGFADSPWAWVASAGGVVAVFLARRPAGGAAPHTSLPR